jgi:hypothetical protein
VTFHFQNVTRLQALFPQVFHAFGDVFFKKVKPIGIFIKEVNFSLMGVKGKLTGSYCCAWKLKGQMY